MKITGKQAGTGSWFEEKKADKMSLSHRSSSDDNTEYNTYEGDAPLNSFHVYNWLVKQVTYSMRTSFEVSVPALSSIS